MIILAEKRKNVVIEEKNSFNCLTIPREILFSKGKLSPLEKICLSEINALDNERGCFALNKHFSDVLEVSERSARRTINSLVKKGFVVSKIKKSGERILNIDRTKLSPPPDKIVHPPRTKLSTIEYIENTYKEKEIYKEKEREKEVEKRKNVEIEKIDFKNAHLKKVELEKKKKTPEKKEKTKSELENTVQALEDDFAKQNPDLNPDLLFSIGFKNRKKHLQNGFEPDFIELKEAYDYAGPYNSNLEDYKVFKALKKELPQNVVSLAKQAKKSFKGVEGEKYRKTLRNWLSGTNWKEEIEKEKVAKEKEAYLAEKNKKLITPLKISDPKWFKYFENYQHKRKLAFPWCLLKTGDLNFIFGKDNFSLTSLKNLFSENLLNQDFFKGLKTFYTENEILQEEFSSWKAKFLELLEKNTVKKRYKK